MDWRQPTQRSGPDIEFVGTARDQRIRATAWALDLIRPDNMKEVPMQVVSADVEIIELGRRRYGKLWVWCVLPFTTVVPTLREVIEDSVVRLSMTNGSGYVDITRHTDLADGSAIVLTQTVTPAGKYIYHSQAVPLDDGSITEADREGTFIDVPMGNAFSLTDPNLVRDETGALLETFGFTLNSDKTMNNFYVEAQDDGSNYDYYREGVWSQDGRAITKEFCRVPRIQRGSLSISWMPQLQSGRHMGCRRSGRFIEAGARDCCRLVVQRGSGQRGTSRLLF